MVNSSPMKEDQAERSSSAGTPTLSEVELESALLRSVVHARPVGYNKHMLMIQLQSELLRRTGLLLPIAQLWDKLGVMFDIPALESMASQSSSNPHPDTFRELSPLPTHRGRALIKQKAASNSASPLSDPSRSPPPSGEPSQSARVINAPYFRAPFTLPYFRLGQDQWKSNLYMPPKNGSDRSRSVASSSTPDETEQELMLVQDDEEPDMSGGEEMDWKVKIYEEDERATKGVNQEAEDEEWEKGITKQLTAIDEAKKEEIEPTTASTRGRSKGNTSKKKKGRSSKGRHEREDTSDLSDEGENAEANEQEAEEEVTKGRSKRPNAGKRKRDSTAKAESEEEKEVKETKPRRTRK